MCANKLLIEIIILTIYYFNYNYHYYYYIGILAAIQLCVNYLY